MDNLDELKLKIKEIYSHIEKQEISHGRVAEILGIPKADFLDICDSMSYHYLDRVVQDDIRIAAEFKRIRPKVKTVYPKENYFWSFILRMVK